MLKVDFKVDTKKLEDLIRDVDKAVKKESRTGFDDTPHGVHKVPVSVIAYYNTKGSKGGMIPKRPFMQDGAYDSVLELRKVMSKGWANILKGYSYSEVLKDSGKVVAEHMEDNINNNDYDRNAASTIRKKGKDNPLTDTGTLPAYIKVKVEKI